MRTDKEINIIDIAGERVAVRQGSYETDMTRIIAFNPMAEWLWNRFTDKDFTEDDVINILEQEYSLEKEIAVRDAKKWLTQCLETGIIKN